MRRWVARFLTVAAEIVRAALVQALYFIVISKGNFLAWLRNGP